jgi:predicted permease
MSGFWQDARYALRMMRRSPGFTAVAVLSLALGIGANTAIFSLINTLMLRSLPVQEPARLVELLTTYPGQTHWNAFSWQAYQHIRDHSQAFSSVIAVSEPWLPHVRTSNFAERIEGGYVTENFFSVLGVKAAIGRLIGPGDEDAAVVSWSYWKSRFNLDPAILGKRIFVEDQPVRIIGVAPREFLGLQIGSRQYLWLPLAMEVVIRRPSFTRSTSHKWLRLVGRLKPGATIQQARAEAEVLYRQVLDGESKTNSDPHLRNWGIELEPAGAGLSRLRDQFARPLVLLMGIVAMLLLIGCSNVANMLLARGAARQREMALRTSLGASKFRLVRQVLTESLLLSAAGGVFGIFLAYAGTGVLLRMIESGPERIELQVEPDLTILFFTATIAVVAAVFFGLAPALPRLRCDPTLNSSGCSERASWSPRLPCRCCY